MSAKVNDRLWCYALTRLISQLQEEKRREDESVIRVSANVEKDGRKSECQKGRCTCCLEVEEPVEEVEIEEPIPSESSVLGTKDHVEAMLSTLPLDDLISLLEGHNKSRVR